MGILSKFKSIGKKIVNGAIKAMECTLDVCSNVARKVSDVCHAAAEKIKKWRDEHLPNYSVPKPVKRHYEPIVHEASRIIKERFPNGVKAACEQLNEEERVQSVVGLVNDAAACLGVKNPPEVELFIPDNIEDTFRLYGSYNHRENKLRLNLPMIVSGEPELLHEQISTVFHELVHARQHSAVEAWCKDQSVEEFGYTEEYVASLANNFVHYIRPEENFEAYTKQPVELEAYYFEHQIKPLYC